MKKKILAFLVFAVLCIGNIMTVSASDTEEITVLSPVIQEISVLTEEIKAPGEVEMEITLSPEGTQELSCVRLVFSGKSITDKMLYYWLDLESISGASGKYVCTLELGKNVPADTYILREIELYDSEDNTRTYVCNEDEVTLTDWAGGHETESVELVVVEGNADTDHEMPLLQELFFDTVVLAGEKLEVTVKAADLSGIKDASIVFYNHNLEQYLFLNDCEAMNLENGTYKFLFEIHKYTYADNYELDSITLTDGSAYANSTKYWLDGSYLKDANGRKVAISTAKKYLKIEQKLSMRWATIDTSNLYNVVTKAKDNETIVVIGGDSEGSQWIMNKRSLDAARIRNLKFILPDLFSKTEILIDTSEIPTQLPEEVYAGIEISEFENGYFDLMLQMTEPSVPFQMKFQTKELDSLKGRTFSLVKVEEDGAETLVSDGYIIDKEGYLNFEFAQGIDSGEGWTHFRIKRNENKSCETNHVWREDSAKKASMQQEGHRIKVCTICGALENQNISRINKVTLATEKFIHNGSVKKPAVTVKDVKGKKLIAGTDYKVTYATGRKSVGRYAVKITFCGNYTGTVTKYFTIVPKAVTNLSAVRYQYGNQVRLTWNKSTGATGYRVYVKKASASKYTYLGATKNAYYTKGSLIKNTAYRFKVIPYFKTSTGTTQYYSDNAYKTVLINTVAKGNKLVQASGVKAVKSGTKVKVSWKNIKDETGYQISRSTSKTGTNIIATYKTTNGRSKTVSATKNKSHYYKVRAYRVVGDKKIFGAWSNPVKYTRK